MSNARRFCFASSRHAGTHLTGRAVVTAAALFVLALLPATVTTTSAAAAVPAIDYTLSGPLGDDGWYVGPVTIAWSVVGATDSNCPSVETLRDDTTGVRRS